jgi:predicted nuclease of predicted toxin-antitoxin system
LQHADDDVIFERAAVERRIVVSADADFGTLLAVRSSRRPSVIQFRGEGSRKPDALARTLLANLPQLVDALENGSIVTFEPARVRVRLLPIGSGRGDE